jgi:hypothetical protein
MEDDLYFSVMHIQPLVKGSAIYFVIKLFVGPVALLIRAGKIIHQYQLSVPPFI